MAEENKTKFTIDLDTKEALESILHLKDGVSSLGSKESLSELIEGLTRVGELAGVLGVAYFALKGTFDAVFDSEKIAQINQQFETLSDSIGIAGDELKKQLEESSHGLVGEVELLQSANKAIIKLGENATHMGETMELARQISVNMGGSVTERFDQLNQAIASGNTRLLRQAGLFIDQKKALQDYASSLGVSTEALTQQGKQHAILNATLAEGRKRFGETDESVLQATNAWTQFKVAMGEVGETLQIAWAKIAGPTVTTFMKNLAEGATNLKLFFKSELGEGAEAAEAKVSLLKNQVKSLQKTIDDSGKSSGVLLNLFGVVADWDAQKAKLEGLKTELKNAEAAAEKLKTKVDSAKKAGAGAGAGGEDGGEVNNQVAQKERIAFEQKLNQAVLHRMDVEKQVSTDIQGIDLAFQAHSIETFKQFNLQKEQIQNSVKKGDVLGQQRADAQIVELERSKVATLKKLNEQRSKDETQILQNIVNQNRDSARGITAQWALMSHQSKVQMTDFAQLGQRTFSDLGNSAIQMFQDIGAGQQSAGEIAKKFLFNFLGDRAISEGSIMLLSGIWPPNPAALAGGGALIALGSFLKSQAGGGGASPPTAAAATGATPAAGGSTGVDTSQAPAMQEQAAMKKSVSIHIQGNYFDTDQTRMAIVQMVRDNQDATDFNVNKIGV